MPELRAILTYHSIDESGSVVSLSPDAFRAHLRSLFERGIQTATPERLLSNERLDPAHPAAALTFDDGFDNFYTHALPILDEYQVKATVFVVPGFCGQVSGWADQFPQHSSRRLMTWSRIEEIRRAGIAIGAHSMTHADLTNLSIEEARQEILDSKRAVEDKIGDAVTAFAYPYGAESPELNAVVAEHFVVGCSTRMGYLKPEDRPENLPRLDAYYLRDIFWFRRLFRGTTNAYLSLRAGLRDARLRQWKRRAPRQA